MGLTKQAKILTKGQQETVLLYLSKTKHPERNKLIFMLSSRAGLRAKEIASLTKSMVTDAVGTVGDCISLQNKASKGDSGGVIWLNKELKEALVAYLNNPSENSRSDHILLSSRGKPFSAQQIVNMFWNWYKELSFEGCSSHSGRRSFITTAARKISTVGGSIKDVQMLARHSSLQMTQRYIEADIDAQKKVVQLV